MICPIDDPNAWAKNGLVFVTVDDNDGHDTTNIWHPSYAREMAAALIAAADEAEKT